MNKELFQKFIFLIDSVTGIHTPQANYGQVGRAIKSHSALSGEPPEKLIVRLQSNKEKLEQFLNDVLIGETYFFREAAHFDALKKYVLPELFNSKSQIHIWSAACSSGEEAISLAVITDNYCAKSSGCTYRISAGDINSKSLSRLSDGVYPYSSLRKDGSHYHRLLLNNYSYKKGEHTFSVEPAILKKIRSDRINIFSEPLEKLPQEVDVIFFRNTLLYFDEEKRKKVIDRLTSCMRPHGYLFLASSELPFVRHQELNMYEYGQCHLLKKAGPMTKKDVPKKMDVPKAPSFVSVFDPNEVLEILRNSYTEQKKPSQVSAKSEFNIQAAEQVASCMEAINHNQRNEAKKILEIIHSEFPLSAIAEYCNGWFHYTAQQTGPAETSFYKAIQLNPQFWPARFYYAQLLTHSKPQKALIEFSKCLKSLNQMSFENKNRFSFFVEGFDESYFTHMCTRWIEKLQKSGAVRWQ